MKNRWEHTAGATMLIIFFGLGYIVAMVVNTIWPGLLR